MIEALYKGILGGLVLALSIGPAFFALIQLSINKGIKPAIAFAFGIFFSDLVLVVLAYLGASQLFNDSSYKTLVGVSSGIILVVFGTYNMFQKTAVVETADNLELRKNINIPLLISKGFALNTLNPFALIFWAAAVTTVSSEYEFSMVSVILFFSGTLVTVLGTDILKAVIAHRIKHFLKPRLLLWVNRIAGIFLTGFGISMIYRAIF